MSTSQSSVSNAPGQFDVTFGADKTGAVYINAISGQSKLLPDGSLLTLGLLTNRPDGPAGSVKHRPDGLFDSSYGVVAPEVELHADIYEIVVQPDGKVVALGAYTDGGIRKACLARYLTNGQVDASFAENGVKYLNYEIAGTLFNNHALALQEDGKIVAAFNNDFLWSVILRLDSNGQFDTFGQNGVVMLDHITIMSLAIHRSGLVVGGRTDTDAVVMRFLDNGEIDTDFGDNGTVKLKLVFDGRPCVFAIATETDGNITVAGMDMYSSEHNFVARLLPNGNFDGEFNNGKALETGTGYGVYKALAIQGDGKILTLAQWGRGSRVYVVRHNRNGEWDASFGDEGVAIGYRDPQGRPVSSYIDKLQLQPDGKILVSGFFLSRSYIGRLCG